MKSVDDMADEPEVVDAEIIEPEKRKPGFQKGHRKIPGSGAVKGDSAKRWQAREIAKRARFSGIAELIRVYRTGKLPCEEGRVAERASVAARIRCLEQACSFLFPRLSTTALEGPGGDAVRVEANIDVRALMMDPALAAAAQSISLALTETRRTQLREHDARIEADARRAPLLLPEPSTPDRDPE